MRKDVTSDSAVVAEVLHSAKFVSLALADADGPYCVPVNFALDDGMLYLHSAKKGRKIEALRHAAESGAAVAFCAATDLAPKTGEKACQWGYTFRSVLGAGRVRILNDPAQALAGLGVIMKKYSGSDDFPYDDKVLAATAVVVIELDWATARLKLE